MVPVRGDIPIHERQQELEPELQTVETVGSSVRRKDEPILLTTQ
jgi:hypothetical protein